MSKEGALKPLDFIGSSREDLREFPDEVKQDIDLIKQRLEMAEEDYQVTYGQRG